MSDRSTTGGGPETPDPISPITGWTRDRWTGLADDLLLAMRACASPGHARITPPGPPGGNGTAVDGLEGFARTFLLAGFRLAGEGGRDPARLPGLAQWYADGIASGTGPASSERWVRPDEHGQAKVEAASIALILDLTRDWIWDRLSPAVQERVVEYLGSVVGDARYPRTNWVWFRIVVETFLGSVGGPWSAEDIEADLAVHDSFYRGDGWYADGDERSFDHYGGWALHLYPVLWARMRATQPESKATVLRELAAARAKTDVDRLGQFLRSYVRLVGADGAPLVQGRSLTYRFAAAAPLWAGALAEVDTVGPGLLRRAASGILAHFVDRCAPDERGLLTLGWHHEWPRIAQSYSGPSSPYWASKGMLGLALPADHPAWTAVEEPLPVEETDHVWAAFAPGWLVSSTVSDGVVRIVNHGTDHADVGARVGDSPLYARLGYSTRTAPLMSPERWDAPLDQAVTLVDTGYPGGRVAHRAGMRILRTDVQPPGAASKTGVAVGVSVARAHWVQATAGQRDAGSGRAGVAQDAAAITTLSVLRSAWEVRCVRVDPLPDFPDGLTETMRLRVGGWPLAGATAPAATSVDSRTVEVRTADTITVVVAGDGFDHVGVHRERDASPLGDHSATPWVAGPVMPGRWRVVLVGLHGLGERRPPRAEVDDAAGCLRVDWLDGERTEVDLSGQLVEEAPLSRSSSA